MAHFVISYTINYLFYTKDVIDGKKDPKRRVLRIISNNMDKAIEFGKKYLYLQLRKDYKYVTYVDSFIVETHNIIDLL